MATKTSPYNPFDYFETAEEISAYLDEAYRDEDPRMFLIALGHLAKKIGMSKVSEQTGLNRESLYKALSGEGNPNYQTIVKVTRALGLEMHVSRVA